VSAYRRELALLNSGRNGGQLAHGMKPFELAKLCEAARAVCESSDAMPSFSAWCEAKGLPNQAALALIARFENGGFDGQG